MENNFNELNNNLLKAIKLKRKFIKSITNLSEEELKIIPLNELQELVYELGFDEAYEINDRQDLIDYYLDWN